MFLLLMACLRFPETDAETQDSDTAAPDGDCAAGQVSADPDTVQVNNFIVDGLPIYTVAESICVGEDGLSMQATLDVDGETAQVVMSSSAPGSINLPDAGVSISVTQDKVWVQDDIFAGTLTLTSSAGEVLGDLQFEATNADGAQINFGMGWAADL